jgi:predicted amidohydrolase
LLYNVAHLFTPSGNVYTQDKLHVTPYERTQWDIQPGTEIKVFETPLARIGIQICYDIEFPEVARLLTLAGAEMIFVPFSTDEKKAYYRVRYCAHARAVENYIYLVLAGNAGNLPATSYLLNYSQSAVLTPSDFSFPLEATAGLADPNVETVVVADLDLTGLSQQRELGSVRPLHDRRPDLYELRSRQPIKTVLVE